MEKSVVLGIDIGGTNTIYGFVTRKGTIVFHDEIPTNGSKPISNLIERISDKIKEFFSKNR
jgi:glucokinase